MVGVQYVKMLRSKLSTPPPFCVHKDMTSPRQPPRRAASPSTARMRRSSSGGCDAALPPPPATSTQHERMARLRGLQRTHMRRVQAVSSGVTGDLTALGLLVDEELFLSAEVRPNSNRPIRRHINSARRLSGNAHALVTGARSLEGDEPSHEQLSHARCTHWAAHDTQHATVVRDAERRQRRYERAARPTRPR
jgi:hypothetical protein